jgi:hypothetical protein
MHSITSMIKYLRKAGDALKPILQYDKGLITQPTYYGLKGQGTNSFKGSKTQVKWSSPAFPFFSFKGSFYI